jgi:uncharacterized membrane protein YtjA (UPF0391 family)
VALANINRHADDHHCGLACQRWGAAQALYSVSLSALLLMSVVMARYRE